MTDQEDYLPTGLEQFIQHYIVFGLRVVLLLQWTDGPLARAAMHTVSSFSIPKQHLFWPMISRALPTNYQMPYDATRLLVVGIFLGLSKKVEPSWNKTGTHREHQS
jgi:hypothetical protein